MRNRRNLRREEKEREISENFNPFAFRNLYDAVNRNDTVTICIIARCLNRLLIQVSIALPPADSLNEIIR